MYRTTVDLCLTSVLTEGAYQDLQADSRLSGGIEPQSGIVKSQ
jgi:hypothetical protein